MKKLTIWLISFFIAVIVADITFGFFAKRYTQSHDLGGDYSSISYVLKDLDDSLVVLGSSVALGGINTPMLTDSLGITCYNASSNGQTMPYFNTILKELVAAGKKPQTLMLGLNPSDFEGDDMGRRYNFLVPYYGMGYQHIDSGLNQLS